MDILQQLFQYVLHLDQYLFSFIHTYGVWTYAVLFMIIFCETGLVIMPLLPGDSLLFAAGSIAANANQSFSIQLLFLLLTLASILGNKLNYIIGKLLGPKIFTSDHIRFLNRAHLVYAHGFYERHGGKTIIFGRFIPIIRTFAPFVAGISQMNLRQFSFYNVLSAIIWIGSLLGSGYFFGSLPFIKEHFSLVLYGIIGLSLLLPIGSFLCKKIRSLCLI